MRQKKIKQMLRKELTHRIYIIIVMLALAICGSYSMVIADGDISTLKNNRQLVDFLVFISLFPGLVMFIRLRLKGMSIPSPIKWLTYLLLWATITSLLHSTLTLNSLHQIALSTLFPLFAMMGVYTYTIKYGLHNGIYWGAVFMLIIFTMQYVHIYDSANSIHEAHLMTAYYPMYILPILVLHPSKTIKFASVLLVIFLIFSSLKRGGFIALALGLVIYVICSRQMNNHGVRSTMYMLISIGALSGLFYFLANSEFGGVIDRIMNIQEDEGSGRVEIWKTTLDMIQQSDKFSLMVGHGYNAVMHDNPLLVSSHNDFLEAWYDYGFVGVCLYTLSLITLTRSTAQLLQEKSMTSPSLAMQLGFVLILTMIAHVLIYFFMTLFCMTIGLLLGHGYYEERLNSKVPKDEF